jgi:hypothetical protein
LLFELAATSTLLRYTDNHYLRIRRIW